MTDTPDAASAANGSKRTKSLTVSAKWLEMAAIKLELDAEQSLPSWILLGQTHRYCEDLGKAAMLRRAAGIKNVGERRFFLRMNGVAA